MTEKIKCLPIPKARQIANDHGMTRLIVLGIDDNGNFAFTTFGKTKAQCDAMRVWANRAAPGIGAMMERNTRT